MNIFKNIKKYIKHFLRTLKIRANHRRLSLYLRKNYIDNTFPKQDITPKKDLSGKKIIWQYWGQGIDEYTPPIVLACLQSVEHYKGEYEVHLLTYETIKDYIDIPQHIYKKFETNNSFKTAFFSDILRLYLLYAYGGIWIDATVYLTGTIPQHYLDSELFMFERTEKPKDAIFWEEYNPEYFSWHPAFCVRSLNSFIVAKKNNVTLYKMITILTEYWLNEKIFKHYFLFQILYNELTKTISHEKVNDVTPHILAKNIYAPYSSALWEQITNTSTVHKLSYFNDYKEGTVFQNILGKYFRYPYEITPKCSDNVTFCSMLFKIPSKNIENIKNSKRNFHDFYLKSLENLSKKYPHMVLWCDLETSEYIDKQSLPVKKRVIKFSELPFYKYREEFLASLTTMKALSYNEGYLLKDLEPEDVVDYLILVLSKIEVLRWAKEKDFFRSDYFFWIDAGTCNNVYARYWTRFSGRISFDSKKFTCCLMSAHSILTRNLIEATIFQDIALIKAPFEISGSHWYIAKENIDNFYAKYHEALCLMRSKNMISTEQAVFSTMLKMHGTDIFTFSKTENYRNIMYLVSKTENISLETSQIQGCYLQLVSIFSSYLLYGRTRNFIRQRLLYSLRFNKILLLPHRILKKIKKLYIISDKILL